VESSICTDMDLRVYERAIILNEFQGVARVTVLTEVSIGNTAIREEDHNLMNTLRVLG